MLKLTILHINDLHGRVSQLSSIATLIRRIRQEVESKGGHCVFVDAGDSEDTVFHAKIGENTCRRKMSHQGYNRA